MPGTYPRSENPYFQFPKRRSFKRYVDALDKLSRSMAGKLVVESWLNLKGDEAGWHASASEHRAHLTIKSAETISTKGGKIKRKDVGHIFSDGTAEEFSNHKLSLEWMTKNGKIPGPALISELEQIKRTSDPRLVKSIRHQLKQRFSRNGVRAED